MWLYEGNVLGFYMKNICLIIILLFVFSCKDSTVVQQGQQAPYQGQRPVCPDPGTNPTQPPQPQPDIKSFNEVVISQMFREFGTKQISLVNESQMAQSGELPPQYSIDYVPEHTFDEGHFSDSLVVKAGKPTDDCGLNPVLDTVDKKIADCLTRNENLATWNGTSNGTSGEGVWKLVQHDQNREIELWRDERTKLVWSFTLGNKNFCEATGFDRVLTNTLNQPQTINCRQNTVNACADVTVNTHEKGKDLAQKLSWRLPTRNDFLQADINGLRFVLPGFRNAENQERYWTSTVVSGNRAFAWTYGNQYGEMKNTLALRSNVKVICIGRGF